MYQVMKTGFNAFVGGVERVFYALTLLPVFAVALTEEVLAADVDPSAPLDILKTAREKAASSNLNVESATKAGGDVLNIILIFTGVIGVGLAGISLYKLYSNIQQGEQARGSNGAYVVALIVGSIMTILAVVVGVITNFATGSGG